LLTAQGDATLEATYQTPVFTIVDEDAIAGTALAKTGIYALLDAESVTGSAPRLLIAPGFDHFDAGVTAATAIPPALLAVAERLRAIAFIDGPNGTTAEAVTAAGLVAGDRSRAVLLDPFVTTAAGARPASSFAAAVQAKVDNERGFWWSFSNQAIAGITGTSRAIDFALGDPSSEADVLNAAHVTTIVNKNGYTFWGARSLETADPKWKFTAVRRIADMINESVLQSHLWAVDRPITKTYVDEVLAGVRAYLRSLVAQNAILGGDVWADPELNTPTSIANGEVWFDFDFTPTYPAEKVTFRSHLVNDYVETVFS